MKIKDILVEDDTVDTITKEIKKTKFYNKVLKPQLLHYISNFKPHVDDIVGQSNTRHIGHILENVKTLYRGSSKQENDIQKVKFKERGKPKDTQPVIHDLVNKLTKEKFNVPVRNGIFAFPNVTQSSGYGSVYMIIPTGDYDIYYTPYVEDFTDDLQAASHADFGASLVYSLIGNFTSAADEDEWFKKLNIEDYDVSIFYKAFDNISTKELVDKNLKGIQDSLYDHIKKAIDPIEIEDSKKSKLLSLAQKTIKESIFDKKNEIKRYVEYMQQTDTLEGISSEELIVWFDTAYFIYSGSYEMELIFERLIMDLVNENK